MTAWSLKRRPITWLIVIPLYGIFASKDVFSFGEMVYRFYNGIKMKDKFPLAKAERQKR
jgi:hypothetical protein